MTKLGEHPQQMPVQKDFVTEREAARFSEELADDMAKHPVNS
jgi:hypothetical protein